MGLPPPPQFDVDTVRTNEIIMKMPRSMLVEMSKEELARLRATVRAMVKSNRKPILVDPAPGRDFTGYSFAGILRPHPNCVCIITPVV
jgi:hypothetical protein